MRFTPVILSSLLCLCCAPVAQAQLHFKFSDNCTSAYQQILQLKIQPAAKLVASEKRSDPNNLVPVLLENYIDFFTLFFNEDPRAFEQKKAQKTTRLNLMEQGPTNSPLTLFSQAIIHLQWAALEARLDQRWAAGWDFRDAFHKAKENQTKFPAFSPNGMITGPMQMMAATIPKNLKWLSNLMGISGTMEQGKSQLDKFLNSQDGWARLFLNEGIFYHCYLQFYLMNQPDEALDFIRQQKLDLANNHLFAYMAANLHLNNRQGKRTEQIVQSRSRSAEYLETSVWDFEMAYARLFHLESDAGTYFQKFLQTFKGSYYVKDAWLKLSYHYLLQGNQTQYKACLQKVLTMGNTIADADKRALKEAKQGTQPHLLLLKARLLTDGGYAAEAYKLLEGRTSNDFTAEPERLEFMYRVGRIFDEMGQPDRALPAYEATMQRGQNRPEYFAARAALQAGMIYEKKKNMAKAREMYNACIAMKDHDYEESIEQKAKAGLARCK